MNFDYCQKKRKKIRRTNISFPLGSYDRLYYVWVCIVKLYGSSMVVLCDTSPVQEEDVNRLELFKDG